LWQDFAHVLPRQPRHSEVANFFTAKGFTSIAGPWEEAFGCWPGS